MIRIKRAPCPPVLKDAEVTSKKYRHHTVVSKLWGMQGGKCCYCERKIPDRGHAKNVEHFAPQAVFEALRNHWPNLLLACVQCNGEKSDHFPVMLIDNSDDVKLVYVDKSNKEEFGDEAPALIDPSGETNPEAHFGYRTNLETDGVLVGQIYPRKGSLQAATTISVIGLDQTFFHEGRRYVFITLARKYMELIGEKDEGRRQQLLREFEGLMSQDAEFAGFAREFARKYGLDTKFDLDIPD